MPSKSRRATSPPPTGNGGDEPVVLTVRVDKELSLLLDELAELYGVTKTEIVRDGITRRAAELAEPKMIERQVERYRRELEERFKDFSKRHAGRTPLGTPGPDA